MSTHAIEVVEVGELRSHPNADKLSLIDIWGWQCCVGKEQFRAGQKAAYIPPDYLVPTDRAEFAFLHKEGRVKQRITVRRFRGQLSQGLLIPLPESLSDRAVGENVMEALGIERYEPEQDIRTGGNFVSAPSGLYCPKFDVESLQRYVSLFTDGEPVVVTEKLHGANARFVYSGGQQYCGSRTNWMADDDKNVWWKAFRNHQSIGEWCQSNPDLILYGEVFGQVQSLKYGAGKNDIFFAAFAVLDHQRWMDYEEMLVSLSSRQVPMAPLVYRGPFDLAAIKEMAEQDSRWQGANHLSEGVVVVPEKERWDESIGRVCLKVVSNRYLES